VEELQIGLIIALAIMIILSGLFSMSETAYTSVSVFRLMEMADKGDKRARDALNVISDFDQFISATLLVNNMVNITGTTLATIIFGVIFGAATGDFIATVFMLVAVLVFGELIPKSYAKKNSLKVSMRLARMYLFLEAAIWPVSWWLQKLASLFGDDEGEGVTAIGREQLYMYIDHAEKAGTIDPAEVKLLHAVLTFDRKTVLEAGTPREDIISIRAAGPRVCSRWRMRWNVLSAISMTRNT